ncbi:MAG: VWA domain-containing protein [Promethearchaeota archaeon]
MLRGQVGDLSPDHLYHGCKAGFSELLQKETVQPWELASALAGGGTSTAQQTLQNHLNDILDHGTARVIGKTLKYLSPYMKTDDFHIDPQKLADFQQTGISRATNLTDFSEILDGFQEWIKPPDELIKSSAIENVGRSLQAADWLQDTFDKSLHEQIFGNWIDSLTQSPTLQELVDNFVQCNRWEDIAQEAFNRHLESFKSNIEEIKGRSDTLQEVTDEILHSIPLVRQLEGLSNPIASKLSSSFASEMMDQVINTDQFLPMLDQFLNADVKIQDVPRLVAHGTRLGVHPDDIYDRIGDSLTQLKEMIQQNVSDPKRYRLLAKKIPKQRATNNIIKNLAQQAHKNRNKEGMAALLAMNLGTASQSVPEDFATESLNYKGIGTGDNLLKQWFTHRHTFRGSLREKIKEIAKDALLDLAMDWINRGTGSIDKGLIPQNRTRPYLAGDDLDLLDIEATLDSIINAGKTLDQVTEDDLFVYDTGKGRAAFGVLIDISGSMSGGELAVCAIAVVMLLGKLKSEEIAIALFESSTHVVKGFKQERDLDEVADDLLDLKAKGGTQVDAALRWITSEFEEMTQSEFKMIFLLSDYGFAEGMDVVKKHAERLADLRVQYLGASHGKIWGEANQVLKDTMNGHSIKLKSIDKIPEVLIQAIDQFGDTGFS